MTTQQHDNLINGQWVAGDSYSPNLNPSNTADVLGQYTQANAEQMDAAVQAARAEHPYPRSELIIVRVGLLQKTESW